MTNSRKGGRRGFTLVELIVTTGIVVALLGIGLSVFGGSQGAALRTGGDLLSSLVEQGRTTAITRRSPVVMVLLEPGKGGFDDERCRVGLLEVENDPEVDGFYSGRLIQNWKTLPGGVVFFGDSVTGLPNVWDASAIDVSWRNGREGAEVRALVFSPRGGLSYPEGSGSVVLTVGNGTYRRGEPIRTTKSGSRTIRVGRVVARPWNLDA